jgi:CYTH domain-containing protein
MALEIERKFLVASDEWREGEPGVWICQGYLSRDPERTVRVRLVGGKGFLTIKGRPTDISRMEFEYGIPETEAHELLDLCQPPLLEKIRHRRWHEGRLWEIDEFMGSNAGLVVAEIELADPDDEFARPPWLGIEVSDDPSYYNSRLVERPWCEWREE